MEVLKRIQEYENWGIGLFIHWGLYSQLSVGEWTEYIHEREKKHYEELIDNFSAKDFDAEKIVKAAKEMGANYIVLTAKHHEGFHLYDTKGLTTFDSIHSNAHRDLVQEFVSACRKEDIKPFLYMASYDWHSPLYENDFNAYLDYLLKSVKILCQNYGTIAGFWFDGDWNKKEANWKLDRLYGTIRKYQPEAIIINNTGLKNMGRISDPEIDAVTYERHTPEQINHGKNGEKYVAGEISLTMNQHWGYAKNDLHFKSPQEIIKNIAHARHIGANVLINVGAEANGTIPFMNRAIMQQVGKWTAMAKPALYIGRPKLNIKSNGHPDDFVLNTPDYKYLFIHDLKIVGNENVVLGGEGNNLRSFTGIYDKISKITWLDNGEALTFMQDQKHGFLTIDAGGYTYGTDWCIRVAQIQFE